MMTAEKEQSSLNRGTSEANTYLGFDRTKVRTTVIWLWSAWAVLILATGKGMSSEQVAAAIIFPPSALLFVCAVIIGTWRKMGSMYWSRLAPNVRRGILRIYIAVSTIWVLYFGGRLWRDFNFYGLHYRQESDSLYLIAMPLGAAALFIIISWSIDGFRQQPAEAVSHRSQSKASSEVDVIFRKVRELWASEELQNSLLPLPYFSEVQAGVACDQVHGAMGDYGRHASNPIPVNGPIGELIYLSDLRVAESRCPLFFHRLGSMGKVDVFETVGTDGRVWDILFFDLYHPRKSRRSPAKYEIVSGEESAAVFWGTNDFVSSFPKGLPDAISRASQAWIGLKLRPPRTLDIIENTIFVRPPEHQRKYDLLLERVTRGR